MPDAVPDADAELEVELEHAKRIAELAGHRSTTWDVDLTTYSHNPPPCTRSCMKTKRRPGLQSGRDSSGYATRTRPLLCSKEFSGRLRSDLGMRFGRNCIAC